MRWSVFSLFGLFSLLGMTPLASAAGENYAVLIISRERLEVSTPCEIGVYLRNQLSARVFQEQSTSFNLAPGEVPVRLQVLPGQAPGCKPGLPVGPEQVVRLKAGEVRRFSIVPGTNGLELRQASLGY